MATRWARLQKELMHSIGVSIKKHGFAARYGEQAFIAKRSFGRACLHLAFVPHGDADFDVIADIAVRFDESEELVNPGRGSSTAGAEFGNIVGTGQRRWTIASGADVGIAAAEIVGLFESVGLEFFERFSTMERTLDILVRNDRAANLYMPIDYARWRTVLALEWLTGRLDALDQSLVDGEAFLRQRNDPGLGLFLDFAAKVRAMARVRRDS
jgi:hypothetical protein